MPSVILASASPIRAELLRRNHVALEVRPARIDEDAVKSALLADAAPARDIVDQLAELKAYKIAQRHPEALVIGADQILVHQGRILSKARDQEEARAQMQALQGDSHQLLSAAVIFENARPVWRHIGRADLTMRSMTPAEIDAYQSSHGDGVLATVGGYRIEEDGASLFTSITGDYFSILGLPLLELLQILRTRGVFGA